MTGGQDRAVVAGVALAVAPGAHFDFDPLHLKDRGAESVATLYDLMGVAKLAFSRSFDFQIYLWAAVLYLAIVEVVRRTLRRLERSLSKHIG